MTCSGGPHGIVKNLALREITGKFPVGTLLHNRRIVYHLTPMEAKTNIFLGFLSGGEFLVSYRSELPRELDPYSDLDNFKNTLTVRFWKTSVEESKLEIEPYWEFQLHDDKSWRIPSIMFYEFPHQQMFQLFFIWKRKESGKLNKWHIKICVGFTPSLTCLACRAKTFSTLDQRACEWHQMLAVTRVSLKFDSKSDFRSCIQPLSADRILILRLNKGLVSILNFNFLQNTRNRVFVSPSFGIRPKLEYNGCTEGLCKTCYDRWGASLFKRETLDFSHTQLCSLSTKTDGSEAQIHSTSTFLSVAGESEADKIKIKDNNALFSDVILRMESGSSGESDALVKDILRDISVKDLCLRNMLLSYCSQKVIENEIPEKEKWMMYLDELTSFREFKESLLKVQKLSKHYVPYAVDDSHQVRADGNAGVETCAEDDTAMSNECGTRCTSCRIVNEVKRAPHNLSLVSIHCGVMDSHVNEACSESPTKRTIHDEDNYLHWFERECAAEESSTDSVQVCPGLLSGTECRESACSAMPWLLMNDNRSLSYASEVIYRCAEDSSVDDFSDTLSFVDIPLLTNNTHLPHDSTLTKSATSNAPVDPSQPVCRVEELIFGIRSLLFREYGIQMMAGVLFFLECVDREKVYLRVNLCDFHEQDICFICNLKTGDTSSEWMEKSGCTAEVEVRGLPGSNAVFQPDIGVRLLSFVPDSLEDVESLSELVDDSGTFCIRIS